MKIFTLYYIIEEHYRNTVIKLGKIFEFINEKKYIIIGILCAVFISLTMKTQNVIITYGDSDLDKDREFSMQLEYSLFGYCVRASNTLKAAEPAVSGELYFGGSIDDTVKKAVKQLSLLTEEEYVVGITTLGFPKNNEKLQKDLKEMLVKEGYDVYIMEP